MSVGLPPHRFGLRFHAGDAVEHDDRAVENAQRPLHLDGEVDVTRRVHQVDAMALPVTGHRRRHDGDALTLLDRMVIRTRGPVMDLAGRVDASSMEQHALGQRGLARVDVRDDPDIANTLDFDSASHDNAPAFARKGAHVEPHGSRRTWRRM
jgi:hypothetical protein